MALSSSVALAVVEMAIYLILAPIVLFLLLKHRLVGILGWFYLNAFVAVRIAGDAITIADRNQQTQNLTTAAILNSIGLSPLILSTAGVLHEATHYATSDRRVKFFNLNVQIFVHGAAVAGIALGVTAGVKLSSPETSNNQYSKDHSLQEAGAILVLLAWLANVGYAIWLMSMMSRFHANTEAKTLHQSRTLLLCSMLALPFVGCRTFYSVTYAFDHSPSVSPITAKFALKFVLIFLVQLIAAISLIVGGLLTRNIACASEGKGSYGTKGVTEKEEDHREARQMSERITALLS